MTFRVGLTRDFLNEKNELMFGEAWLEELKRQPGIECEFMSTFTPEVTPEQLKGFHAVISMTPRFTRQSLAGAEQLVAIGRWGVGYDMIDVKACTEADVALYITPEGVKRPVAQSIMTFLYALSGKLLIKDRMTREGRWSDKLAYPGIGLAGKVFGSVGLGNIAKEMFHLARPLNMVQLAYDPYAGEETAAALGVTLVDMDTLIAQSDFLTINCPLTPDTTALIGEAELSAMKPTAYLINTARGPIVDQQALVKALQNNWIAGAGLDVFAVEPIAPDDPLLQLDNVIVTPHALCWTDELYSGIGHSVVQGILKVMRGELPDAIVNKQIVNKPSFQAKLAQHKN
ncbi:NAD(P)-dependent oxidoreductase [Paenibacillus sp. GCM10027626]|uniref:NAD(P)-dependent oxidoreductase n=1 Tax=Paenibacillus sp. GCM10027626 TaxID=3273411 RepID=UPI003627A61D